MSELYMDDIDRMLLEDYRKKQQAYILEFSVTRADEIHSDQAVPDLSIEDKSAPEDNYTRAS